MSYDTTRRVSTKTRGTVTKNKDTRAITMTAKGPPSRMKSNTNCNGKKRGTRISIKTSTIGRDTDRRRTSKGYKTLVGELRGSTSRAPTRGTATKSRGRGGKKRAKTAITRTKGTVNTRTRGETTKKTRRKDVKQTKEFLIN